MIIEYDVSCFERTLVIKCPNSYAEHEKEIKMMLDKAYYEWHSPEDIEDLEEQKMVQDSCCEEHMMFRLSETYNMWEEWDSIYYGDDEEEMYETVPVKNPKLSTEEDQTFTRFKCKYCDFAYWDVDNDVEEALWGHIQMHHEDKFEEVQNWETPDMIEECYKEEM